MGVEAVNAVMEATGETEPCVIGIQGNQMVRNSLVECVKQTQRVAKAVEGKEFDLAMQLRGPDFVRVWETMKAITKATVAAAEHEGARILPLLTFDELIDFFELQQLSIAVMNVGAPAPGMNSAARTITRLSIGKGHKVYAIYDGFRGLADDEVQRMSWLDVDSWSNAGGALLGSNRDQPGNFLSKAAETLKKYSINVRLPRNSWSGGGLILNFGLVVGFDCVRRLGSDYGLYDSRKV